VLGGIAAGGWYFFAGGQNDAYVRGVQYYQRGQREAAAGEFNKAVRDDPNDPMPHVYLSRMAREVGNYPVALQEAQKAVELGQDNVAALREMGSYLMTVGNYDLARRFYVRAVSADTTDRASLGWLGCSLVKLGRIDDGMRFINRAGTGQWQSCVPGGAMVPGQGYPAQPLPTAPGQGYPPRP
jgi:Tfp pilus assembly protein PilF